MHGAERRAFVFGLFLKREDVSIRMNWYLIGGKEQWENIVYYGNIIVGQREKFEFYSE